MNKNNGRCGCDADAYLCEFKRILEKMICGMTGAELNDSISHNFIVQMIPHHMAAIEMSRNVLKYISNEELSEIAEGIITEQTKSIKNMEKILNNCTDKTNCCRDVQRYQRTVGQIMNTMFSEMKVAYSDDRICCDFMREMIPHHMGAVRMSKNALRFDICPELKPILDAIITSQEKGICQMTKLLRRLGCSL